VLVPSATHPIGVKINKILSFFTIFRFVSFSFAFFAWFGFVSLLISSVSLRSETCEKSGFFSLRSEKMLAYFSLRFALTENERRTLGVMNNITDKIGRGGKCWGWEMA
jgi:hypothetical protein